MQREYPADMYNMHRGWNVALMPCLYNIKKNIEIHIFIHYYYVPIADMECCRFVPGAGWEVGGAK